MKKFNENMSSEKRKVLILLDQAPCHPKNFECFGNLQFLFFPKNATSLIQPLDLGIIKALKSHYMSILARHNLIIEEQNNIKYSILDCMKSLEKAWDNVSSSMIVNCFRKSKVFTEGKYLLKSLFIYSF